MNHCVFCGKDLTEHDWEEICPDCEEIIKINGDD